ncbi:MAG: transposase [Patescibacteria group bacterium]
MANRKIPFATGEYYHLYNRGIDKRNVFSNQKDLNRFFQSMIEFNTTKPIGSIYENSFVKSGQLGGETSKLKNKNKKLVNFVAYCLNSNHYHFIIKQTQERGIEKFMQRLGTGYTMYFNEKEKRSGSLFQGVFKSLHINTNEYLLHLSAYVNLNDRVHQLGSETSKLVKSSWREYIGDDKKEFCKKDIILGQFRNTEDYKTFTKESLAGILDRRYEKEIPNMKEFLLE